MGHVGRQKEIEKNLKLHTEGCLQIRMYGIMREIKEKTEKSNKDERVSKLVKEEGSRKMNWKEVAAICSSA